MQTFKDSTSQQVYQYEDDVVVTNTSGVYSFMTAGGTTLKTPTTLQPYVIPAPTASELLIAAQTTQVGLLMTSYTQAIQVPVSYTSKGGLSKLYQAGTSSVSNLVSMILTFQSSATTPSGFYWVALDNTQVPFTYSDLQGLANVIGLQGAAAFQHLQTLKTSIASATTIQGVQAIIW